MTKAWRGWLVGAAIGLTGCSGHGHVESPNAPDAAVSVDEILRGGHAFAGKSVAVRGHVCWSPRHEDIYGIFDNADDCRNGRYVRSIELLSEELRKTLPGQSGIAFVSLVGVYNECANCVSTGPIGNGYIKVSSLRKEPPCEVNCRLMELLAAARDRQHPGERGQAAADMAYAAAALSPADTAAISNHTVDSMAKLLEEDDPIVKMYAALALGELGGRASRALPALYKALQAYRDEPSGDYILSSVDGRAEIMGAIKRVEATEGR